MQIVRPCQSCQFEFLKTRYELLYENQRYASKAIIGLAYRSLIGRVLAPGRSCCRTKLLPDEAAAGRSCCRTHQLFHASGRVLKVHYGSVTCQNAPLFLDLRSDF